MIKGIIFDIDGTLLNHEEALQRAIASLYSFTKTKIPQSTFDEFLLIWKTKTNQFMNDYLDGKISFEQQRILRVQSVFSKWDYQLSSAQAMDLPLFPDLKDDQIKYISEKIHEFFNR